MLFEEVSLEGLEEKIVYVGARTTRDRNARGHGLNVYRLGRDLSWQHLQLLEMENPSFLAFDRLGQHLYTVHGDSDQVSAYRIDAATGLLERLNCQTTKGRNPVHLSFDATNKFMIVANHVTSSLAVLPRLTDGSLGEVSDLVEVAGQIGPHRVEQPFPKPHQAEFDPSKKWIAVPDKGTDKILIYGIGATGKLFQVSACDAREGSGPRHIAFHPGGRLAYVINELNSTVAAYRFDPDTGTLRPFQILSSLLDRFIGNSRGAEIAVSTDGRFVYASNRGSNTVAGFAIDGDGTMTAIGHWNTGGKTPRFFTMISETVMLAANEDSDTITAFTLDHQGGLRATGSVLRVGSPVCILSRRLA
jgi:6-phosphogluconolactonase